MHTFNMMEKRLHFWFVTLCLILLGQLSPIANAQDPRTIEVGPHFGGTAFIGDFEPWKQIWENPKQLRCGVGVLARYNYDLRWSYRIDYTYLQLHAEGRYYGEMDQSLHDLSLLVEFNFHDYYTGRSGSEYSPYIFAGLSAFYPIPVSLSLFGASLPFGLSLPFGIGYKVSLSKRFAATLDLKMHCTFSDGLDGGGVGNTLSTDWFGMVNLSFTYKFVPGSSFLSRLLLVLSPFYYTKILND